MSLLNDLIAYLRTEGTSRRAVYNSLDWMRDLPEPKNSDDTAMLISLLAYQFDRQCTGHAKLEARDIAQRLAKLCAAQKTKPLNWLANFMGVAEFLARETRTGAGQPHTYSGATT